MTIRTVLKSAIDRIEHEERLDPVAGRLVALLAKPLSPRMVRSVLSGTPIGHAVHPAIVAAPMGAWLAASYLDATGGTDAEQASRRLIAVGLVTAAPAVLTGLNDWSYTDGAERRVGVAHAACNDLAYTLYASSWIARRIGRRKVGIALAATGATLLGVGGWLGGHLSYARGVGVDTTAFQVAPQDWFDVLREEELADDVPTLVHAGGVPVLLLRSSGTLTALADRCTHRGAPLHEGSVAGGCITCPWHGGVFRLSDGEVVEGPPTREQPVYEVRLRYGSIQVRRPVNEPGSLRTNPVS